MSLNLIEEEEKMSFKFIGTELIKTPKRRGRPPVECKKEFRNVAVPLEVHQKIKELAELEDRTIAKQLKTLIESAHADAIEARL